MLEPLGRLTGRVCVLGRNVFKRAILGVFIDIYKPCDVRPKLGGHWSISVTWGQLGSENLGFHNDGLPLYKILIITYNLLSAANLPCIQPHQG